MFYNCGYCIFQAKLTAVQQERDLAVAKSKQLNDEIQTLRIYYRYDTFVFETILFRVFNSSVLVHIA